MNQTAIKIEPDGRNDTGTCACCGRSSRTVWGYAYEGDACVASYFVHWTIGHVSDHGANFDMIIGPWGEGAASENRNAVSLAYRLAETGPSFMVIDARTRPIARSPLVGNALDRNQVLGTPTANRAFDIADAVLAYDERISEILGGWQIPA